MPFAALTILMALQTTPSTPPAAPTASAAPQVRITELALGKGAEAVKVGDLVEVNYVGKLKTGKEFDRSRDVPFRTQVGLGKVIAGWDQGLLGLKAGGKRRLEIPAVLGYGAQSVGEEIPANSDLDFEVELVKIHRAKVTLVKPGTGVPLGPTDVPTFHYTLSIVDPKTGVAGKKVASSRDNNVPATAPLTQLIPGFVQALLGMKPGEVRKAVLSPELAYGAQEIPPQDRLDDAGKVVQAKGSLVPANATLLFELELISAVKSPQEAPGSSAPR